MREITKDAVRVASVFEAAKGLVVLAAGFGVLLFIHQDIHRVATKIVLHLHMNPARRYPTIFLDALNHVNDRQLLALAISALFYAMIRFVESYGLWFHRAWAEWFGVLTGGVYIPVELYELLHGVTWIKLAVFLVNLAVVVFLGNDLYRAGRR